MKVLPVGGNGFIGSHIQDLLLRRGHSVRFPVALPERYRPAPSDVDYRAGSSADAPVAAESLAGMDSLVYLANTTVPSTSNSDVSWDVQSNLIPLVATLEGMKRTGVEHIVFLSSAGTVYGVTDEPPVQNAASLDPICSYGVVRVACEEYLGIYRHLYGLRPLVLRPSNPFGPRQGHAGCRATSAPAWHGSCEASPSRFRTMEVRCATTCVSRIWPWQRCSGLRPARWLPSTSDRVRLEAYRR